MGEFWLYILTAVSLVFVIEGLIYALFPDAMRRMMAMALSLPPAQMRNIGFAMALTGFCFIWILQGFAGR